MTRKLIYWYLVSFVILDIVMGLLLKFMGLEGVIPINPGQVIRAILLICLGYTLIKDQFHGVNGYAKFGFVTLIYFLIASVLLGSQEWSLSGILVDFYNVSKILFVLLLGYYVQRERNYFRQHSETIFDVNFLALTTNLTFSFITGIGLETYEYAESSTKGFLYGGNAASILSLIFFIYYFFQAHKGRKQQLFSFLALFSIYIVGTKVIFLVPAIVGLYFLLKVDWSLVRVVSVSVVLVPIFIYLVLLIQPVFTELIQNRYLETLEQTGLLSESNNHSYNEILQTYRRTAAALEQLSVQLDHPWKLLFGYGEVGQNNFWEIRGAGFKFAAMDFFDLMFQYGMVGAGLFYTFVVIALKRIWVIGINKPISISFLFIFLYSFFGGYVLYATTAGTLFAYLMGLNLDSIEERKIEVVLTNN